MRFDTSLIPPADRLLLSHLFSQVAPILMPPPSRNAGEWADEHRILPPGSPEPGPWRTDRVPFWKPIYAAVADPQYETVVIVCGSQMSKSEALLNIIGHRFTDGPYYPAMYIGPTEKNVRSMSRDRFDSMLRSTAILWERLEKGHRNGVFEKFIAGVRFGFAWAGSATELASHPCGLVLMDERDRMVLDADGEGDPKTLAKARMSNYLEPKMVIASTPTVEGVSVVWKDWESGTMHMLAWPCLGCGKFFVPHLKLLKWPDKATPDEALRMANVVCPYCGREHVDREKPKLNALSRFIRHRSLGANERNERAVLDHYCPDENPQPSTTASFWMSGLASPWNGFGRIAADLVVALRSGDPETIQGVINTKGGELFRIKGEAPAWAEVSENRAEYEPGQPPHGVQVITMGADVQKNGIYYVIRGWGHMMESWLLDQDFIAGETEYDAVWSEFRRPIMDQFNGMPIRRVFVDSGYRPGDEHRRPDHAVYTFARSFPGTVFPTKGQDTLSTPYIPKDIDYSYGGKVIKGGVRLYHLDTDYAKRWLHARIRWPKNHPGGFHLHRAATEDYCRQLVAEELVIKASGRPMWIRKARANHFLDCEVNALMAALSLGVHKLAPAPVAVSSGKTDSPVAEVKRQSRYERRSL